MGSVFSKSKLSIIIFVIVCALLWVLVFFIMGTLNNKKRTSRGITNIVFETSLVSDEVKKIIELDNFSVDVKGMLDGIESATQKINDNINGVKPDSETEPGTGSGIIDSRLNISLDESKTTYFVYLNVSLDSLPDISYEIQGVTLIIEKVFRNKMTNKPDYLRHYTYELPGPVKADKAVMKYQKGKVVIILPKD